MLAKTHLAVGAMSGAILLPVIGIPVRDLSFPPFFVSLLPNQSVAPVTHAASALLTLAITMIGSEIPDLDEPHSKITREIAPVTLLSRRLTLLLLAAGFFFLSMIGWLTWPTGILLALWLAIPAFSKHRGLTHSLLGVVLAYVGVHAFYPPAAVAFAVGHISHIICDSLTDSGVPLLWPWKKRFHVPTGLSTGSIFEKFIQLVAMIVVGFLLVKTRGFTLYLG